MKFLRHASRTLASALAFVFVLAACGGEGGKAVDPIPTELAGVESAAEAGYDAALAPDRAKVTTAAQLAKTGWASYLARAAGDGAPAGALEAVRTALDALDSAVASNAPPLELARAFNRVSAPMARLYDVYKPPVPAALLDLDYLGREVRLDARAADFARATADLDTLTNQWTAVRASVVAAGGTTQASQMDGTLVQARRAITANDAAALEVAAVAEADAVDIIEGLFAQLDAPD
jgi:hypothetical protein